MNPINAEFIERYQLLYQKDPNSKVFAPLAEAYRKMGLVDEAFRVCEAGVQKHPNFPSGRVAFAKVLIEKKQHEMAIKELKAAIEISPENILAHLLLGECYLQLKYMKEALKSYKMVLYLNPNDQRALSTVKKLESLTADEYDDEVFKIKQAHEAQSDPSKAQDFSAPPLTLDSLTQNRILERNLSLADAYIVRNDIENALKTLDRARDQIGKHPELEKRKKLLLSRQQAAMTAQPPVIPETLRREEKARRKIEKLHRLTARIHERRINAAANT
jgi:tetratricopeptide (TPR) repeat protein